MTKANFNSIFLVSFSISIIMLGACKSGTQQETSKTDSTLTDNQRIDSFTAKKKTNIQYQFFNLEANLPAPFSVVNDIYSYNLPYRNDLLNSPSNLNNYTSKFSKEINYGVYGLDMGYISFYGHNKDLLDVYNATQNLAGQLNVSKLFDEFAERFKANADNRDSTIVLLDAVYGQTDDYLKKNNRFVTASNILAGALIELNYLSLNLLKDVKQTPQNAPLFEKVYNENLYIYYLKKLFAEYKDKESQDLLASMTAYTDAYGKIIQKPSEMTPENINKAVVLVTDLRNKLVK